MVRARHTGQRRRPRSVVYRSRRRLTRRRRRRVRRRQGGGAAINAHTIFDAVKKPIEVAKSGVVAFQTTCSALTGFPSFLYPGTKINCHLSPSVAATADSHGPDYI